MHLKTKFDQIEVLLKGVYNLKLLNISLASYCLINLFSILSYIAHCDENIIFRFFFFITTFLYILSAFFSTLQTIQNHCIIYILHFILNCLV